MTTRRMVVNNQRQCFIMLIHDKELFLLYVFREFFPPVLFPSDILKTGPISFRRGYLPRC